MRPKIRKIFDYAKKEIESRFGRPEKTSTPKNDSQSKGENAKDTTDDK